MYKHTDRFTKTIWRGGGGAAAAAAPAAPGTEAAAPPADTDALNIAEKDKYPT